MPQTQKKQDMGTGDVKKLLLQLMIPAVVAQVVNLLYNIVDRIYIGHISGIGAAALTGVGLFTPILMLLNAFAMLIGAGGAPRTAIAMGQGDKEQAEKIISNSFTMLMIFAVLLTGVFYASAPTLLRLFGASDTTLPYALAYSRIYILGSVCVLMVMGMNPFITTQGFAKISMLTTVIGAVINIILDPILIFAFGLGVQGAAIATVFSQFVSGVGIGLYTLKQFPELCPRREDCKWDKHNLGTILNLSVMTSVQQSIMNFGILMVQGLVNSFGTVIMAAFAAAVKIDSFAYMPVQDFGNAFSTYVAQNYGANQPERIRKGIRSAAATSAVFCICISVLVCLFAAPLIQIFMDPSQTGIVAAGVHYLHIEGACYLGIGILFLLYGYYRAVNQPGMSVILTIASLGTRVALAYLLSATPLGVTGIWLSVPIGWALADAIGIGYYFKNKKTKAAA